MSLQKTIRIREVQARTTSRGDIYDIQGDDNLSYATFDKGVALTAQSLAGAGAPLVNLTYNEKQKGQYTNRYAEKVEQAQAQTSLVAPGGPLGIAYAPDYRSAPTATMVPQQTFQTIPHAPQETDKDLRIMRQTATKVAVQLLPYLPEHERTPLGLLTMSDYLVDYYVGGVPVAPGGFAAAPSGIASDPGAELRPPLTDNDIPF